MEIQRSGSVYSNFATLFQSQRTSSMTDKTSDSSTTTKTDRRFDTVEISDEAYAAYAQSISQSLEDLVSDGTLTSDQADSVESALSSTSVDVSDGSNPLKTVLDGLVSDNTITSDQEDAIASAMAPPPPPPAPPAPPTDRSEDNTMEDYLSNLLDSLVDDGTLTSDQADSVLSALNSTSVDVSDGSNPLKTVLDSLVSDNTITSDQEEALADLLAPPSSTGYLTTD